VRVRHDEGIATHVDPKPCAVIREDAGEASAGERIGQPLSRESVFPSGCRRRKYCGRQDGRTRQRECPTGPAWSETLACTEAPCMGTGRSPARSLALWSDPHREGEEP
jgi:hypothetical protein